MRTYEDETDKTFDEYSTRDEPQQPSFHDRHGFDERDGPPEEEGE